MGLKERPQDGAHDGNGPGDQPTPRHGRAALLRLASWFEEAEPDRADALATAAYGLYASLHLGGRADDAVAATTSWWQADPDRSPVTERPGTRPPEPVRDHRAQRARLRDAAESSAHWRRAGAAQVRSLLTEPTGARASLDLSGAGMEVLMELLTAALGSGDASHRPTSAGDLEFSLRLHVVPEPGAEVTVLGEGGELSLEGLRLCVTPYEQHVVELPPLPAPLPEPAAQEPPGPRDAVARGGSSGADGASESPDVLTSGEADQPQTATELLTSLLPQDNAGHPQHPEASDAVSGPDGSTEPAEPSETRGADVPRETSDSDVAPVATAPDGTPAPETPPAGEGPWAAPEVRPDPTDADADADTGPIPVVPTEVPGAGPATPVDTPGPDDGETEDPRDVPPSGAGANPDNETTGPIDLSAHRRDAHQGG
ncbi:DUF2397 family protein [Nocardiopsis lucentensis]|uniref:DUF2397 family protein n=1 Tax=Nocardiopsis lucentensis TaxID=53441 RepID=UPI00034BC5A5|nr:DUF2397 family protein [Nocardiopsis lucentensis]